MLAGFAFAHALHAAALQIAGLEVPLFASFPAVVAVAIALGPLPGVLAMAMAVAYVTVGPASAAFDQWPDGIQLSILATYCGLCLLVCGLVWMLDRRQVIDLSSLLADLGQSEERFKAVVTSLEDHRVCLLDREGKIVGWFGGPCQLTGWTEREVLGLYLSALFPADLAGEAVADDCLTIAFQRGRSQTTTLCRDRSGRPFHADVTVTALARGQSYCAVIRDRREALPEPALTAA